MDYAKAKKELEYIIDILKNEPYNVPTLTKEYLGALEAAISAITAIDAYGCDGCDHEFCPEDIEPCMSCKNNYILLYSRKSRETIQNKDEYIEYLVGLIKDCQKEISELKKQINDEDFYSKLP